MVIPSKISFAGLILGLIYTSTNISDKISTDSFYLLTKSILASFHGFIILYVLKNISEKITKRKCLGIGDAKLSSMGAAWIGLNGINTALFLAFISAGTFAFIAKISGNLRSFQTFPFAPFISASIFSVWILGEDWFTEHWLALWGV